MPQKKYQVWLPLLFSLVMITGMYMGYRMRDTLPGRSFFYTEKPSSIREITDLLNNRYVDSVNVKTLTDTAIAAILSKLDPHSTFIPPNELRQINEEISGNFVGIGIEYNIISDSLNVVNVLPGGPSDKAGLKTGDILLFAGDSSISGHKISGERIRNMLRGNEGSTVKITLLRNGKKQQTEVARGNIPITSIDAAYMMNSNTGYLKLNKFSSKTYKEFMTALMPLKKRGMTNIVLDLRGNGGGVLDQAIEIADEFLDGDKLITFTEGLHSPKKEYRCRREGQFEKGKLAVLADEGTASASEVLMGALQDWDRATIIGRRSFGKGLVQEQYDLRDRSALRLTVARYFTPIGRSIQRSYKKGSKLYYQEIANRYSDGEMITSDSVKNDTAKIYRSQGGKKLYANGGISPDYFIAADTSRLSLTTAKIYSRGTLNDFGYKYYKLHTSELMQYKTASQFIQSYNISENDWKYFESLAQEDSITVNAITTKEKKYIESVLKSSIARQLFRNAGFFEALNEKDKFIMKALEVMK